MRKLITMIVTILFLAIWAMVAATIGSGITEWPQLVQLVFYVVAGIGWVFPLKPLMAWMNSAPKPD